jgi:hypothetical protein
MYIAVRKYAIIPGSVNEVLQRVQEGFAPLIAQTTGFIAYDAMPVGNKYLVTSSIFDTRAGAEESILRALRWVQENIGEFIQGTPVLTIDRVPDGSQPTRFSLAQESLSKKKLVIDLQFKVIQPRELGQRAFDDPTVKEMVTAIQNLLTGMQTDPAGRDAVIYRFESVIHPEEETKKLYEADHVILIHRDGKLAGYAEINRDTNTWLNRDRYEGDILVDPAAYKRNEHGLLLERGIGEQGLLEMRRQGRLLGIKNIELDVYLRNHPMQQFLNHLITTHDFPLAKQDMQYGRSLDYTYLLSCDDSYEKNLADALHC